MPKSDTNFDLSSYATVADRLALFHRKFPDGRILTELVSNSGGEIIFKALVHRSSGDTQPAATGWASERIGDGDINRVACLENTETSAVGRALANLGFTASTRRPSREEMQKAARVSERLSGPPLQIHANQLHDLLRLITRARAHGLRTARADRWHRQLLAAPFSAPNLARYEERLREWITRQ